MCVWVCVCVCIFPVLIVFVFLFAFINSCGFEQAYRLVYSYLLLIQGIDLSHIFFLFFVFILIVFRRLIFPKS